MRTIARSCSSPVLELHDLAGLHRRVRAIAAPLLHQFAALIEHDCAAFVDPLDLGADRVCERQLNDVIGVVSSRYWPKC